MSRAPRIALAATLGFSCLLPIAGAQAAPPLQLLSGLLTISLAPAAATLTTAGASTTGSLGTTTVVDGRLGATGYNVSVTTTGFDLAGVPVTASPTTHIPAADVTAQVTATTGGTASTSAPAVLPAAPLFHLTYTGSVLSVDVLSSYTLALNVSIPAAAATGLYTGTVTQTVA